MPVWSSLSALFTFYSKPIENIYLRMIACVVCFSRQSSGEHERLLNSMAIVSIQNVYEHIILVRFHTEQR